MSNQLNQSEEPLCKVCLEPTANCICPECPQCGDRGIPKCYKEHPLKLNALQLILRTEKKISQMERELDTEQSYLVWLNEQTESYCEDWSEV
ncbi:hypothetical protein LCGC14_2606330 [marine sediment metagenome]|uniref:Uncharacterized protein n=1 Tax=marine sediment metagenome TaxID=412755 RepID=A0A0F9A7H8_9ZZZZ